MNTRPQSLQRILAHIPPWMDPILPPDLDTRAKVVGIGFHKTGTTSLGRALRTLGFRLHKGFVFNTPGKRINIDPPVTYEKILEQALPRMRYYSAFEDNPWPLLYRDIDKAYPGTRFILTYRNAERWYRSAARYHAGRTSPMLDFIYGENRFEIERNRETALRRYKAHNDEVRTYFKDRPNDLLCWDIEEEPNWARLCAFLDADVPSQAFPHANGHQVLAI